MDERQEKGSIKADIPDAAVEEALRSVDRMERGKGEEEEPETPEESGFLDGSAKDPVAGGVEELALVRAELELSQSKARETFERLKEEHERLLRALADTENVKKRAARDREEIQKFGVERLVKDLLPAMDGLDRALCAVKEDDPLMNGVKLVRASLEQALARNGVTGFSALGEVFDPTSHEAMLEVQTSEKPAGTVVLEHARGWRLNERLLRPALVGVAAAPRPVQGESTEPEG